MSNSINNSRVQNFEAWSQDKNNNANMNKGLPIENFQMFEANGKTYLNDVYNFATEYISEYDSNKDGVWSEKEYLNARAGLKGENPIKLMSEHAEYSEMISFYTEYMKDFDSNKNGALNKSEFIYAYKGKSYSKLSDKEKKEMEELFKIYNHLNSDNNSAQITPEELCYAINYSEDLKAKKEAHDSIEAEKKAFKALDLDGDKSTITAAELASSFILADANSKGNFDGKIDFTAYREISTHPEDYKEARTFYHELFE